jgi:hypothetical protein
MTTGKHSKIHKNKVENRKVYFSILIKPALYICWHQAFFMKQDQCFAQYLLDTLIDSCHRYHVICNQISQLYTEVLNLTEGREQFLQQIHLNPC